MRRTKIVCTIGPASDSEDLLGKLIDAGMNVARLNFSHGTHEEHGETIRRIRSVSEKRDAPIAILQDLAGPKIRVGKFKQDSVILEPGQPFVLTNEAVLGDENRAFVSYPKLTEEVKAGDRILLADGSIELYVVKTDVKNVTCTVHVGGELSSNKGINLPESSLSIEAFTEKDRKDLEFGLGQGVDYVAMSFVRSKEDIARMKEFLKGINRQVPIIAKVEKPEALANIDEIIDSVDGIMVARGDLAVETALEKVPMVQKMLILKSNQKGKPVITATQMLKSMIENPRPTRAEANDVANAVLDGTDAVMLSEETTVGKYPVGSVRTMAKIIEATESSRVLKHQPYRPDEEKPESIVSAVSHATSEMAKNIQAEAILTPTQTGSTAKMVASNRPNQTIIALSPDPHVVRCLNLVWGVYPILSDSYSNTEEMIEQAKEKALQSGLVKTGDVVVITSGVPTGIAGTTNLIKVEILK
ncbi:MAG: pyruvate kinase [Candidatus Scalindua sp. AMX11]|nr:MAG: pyruvate kinase [Candidatus Scalindua sp.]NOG84715.1 pyruvate kinase [Planctomycetota bacterium]RZV98323.1 MAG: pyruvate kinase [Candidatus Scalindua sp. SCAELEC01]TDE66584.1 MAG: pyruvate kinase [Candidatus Scalindua sp. AMX11]GJQ58955.1 MAG: pyruvate kinase [Candidatus Scalindua sp.]